MSQRLSISHASVSNPPMPIVADVEDNDPTAASKRGSLWQWIVGCIFLVCVAIIWNFSSVLIQYIFNDLSFEAPFFLTSFGMALFSVNLPIYYVTKVWLPHLGRGLSGQSMSDLPQVKTEVGTEVKQTPHDKATLRRTMIAAAVVAPLWFIANFTYNESLNLTSVTSSTILSATSSVFTLILAIWILKERFTWFKALGVALCMAGNCTTLAKDSQDGISEGFWGDVCALIGAVMYGVYTTAIRKYLPDDAGMSVSLFFGFVGLFSLVVLATLCIIFNYTGVESLQGLTWEIVGLLFVQGLLNNVLADYLWAVSIMYTSTTTATIGLSLTVPMAIFSDWIVNDIKPGYITFISSVLVLGGFVVLAVTTRKEQLSAGSTTEFSISDPALSPKSPATHYISKDIKETMDVMMNMTTEDVRRLRGQFTGSLGLEAFVRLMKKSLHDRIQSELDFVVGVIELFHTIDVNGDAVLDWDEFVSYMMDAGQAKADFYFETRGRSTKHYVPLLVVPPDPKTPLRHIATRVQQMRLLTEQNAVAYFEANSDVVYIYGLQFDQSDGPRHLSTMRLHTAFQEHIVIDVAYVPTRKSLVTSSVLVRGYLSVWSVADLYNPVMTHRLESIAAHEHLCWVSSLQSIATSAVIFPSLQSARQSEPKRDCYRPNAGTEQPHTKISHLELWDLFGKLRAPAPGTIATKEVTRVQERLKGVTAVVAFRAINRTYLAVGREDGILSVLDTETREEVGTFDAHGSGVKVLVYSNEVESLASVGFHSYADETSLYISTWKKNSSGGLLAHDTTLRQHEAPVELLVFVDSNHQLISVDRTETFHVYSSVMRTPTSEPWECLQTFQYSPPPVSNWHLPQQLWSMFVVPETAASDPVLVTTGTSVRFYDHCEVKVREEIFFACYCSALNVLIGATSTKLLLWKGDSGDLWKTYEYAGIVLSTKNPTVTLSQLELKRRTDPESLEAQTRAITAVCVDDRERKIILGDDTGAIKVLNAVNGNVMKELDPHTHCIVDVSYVLYGKRVISISSDSVLHICDENNPLGFYVPFGGGPIQSVLLQSLRLLPEVELTDVELQHKATSSAKYLLMRSMGNENLNLVAVLVADPQGNSFIQVWNFDVSHSQGTCVAPQSCGEITCMSFLGSTAEIVGGTSTGRVFLWSPIPGTTSYKSTMELSSAPVIKEGEEVQSIGAITHLITVCAVEPSQEYESTDADTSAQAGKATTSPLMSPKERLEVSPNKERLRLEHDFNVHVFASDDTGFVSQWHIRRSYEHISAIGSLKTMSDSSGPRGHVAVSGIDVAAFQHEEMTVSFTSIAALYHHARLKSLSSSSPLDKTMGIPSASVALDVVKLIRQWRAHCEAVLSLEMAVNPLAVVTSSASGQIKVWGMNGELYGVLDHFATRRAPLDHLWTFPVDMAARRQERVEEARELLQRPSGSASKALKPRVSMLQERLSLTKRDLAFSHRHVRSRNGNARASDVGRAVRNFILAQTISKVDTKRLAPSSALKAISQDTSSLHSVLRELEQFQLHTDGCTECSNSRVDSRTKKYAMVTLADVKSSLFRPRSSSTVHCDFPSPGDQINSQRKHEYTSKAGGSRGGIAPVKHKELFITSASSPVVNRMELVEYLWQSAKDSNQEKESISSISDKYKAVEKEALGTREAPDGVLKYHVKMAHTWQPYQKQ